MDPINDDSISDPIKMIILAKMVEQLRSVIDGVTAVRPPNMSTATYEKMLRDMNAQYIALTWAYNTCVDTWGYGERL